MAAVYLGVVSKVKHAAQSDMAFPRGLLRGYGDRREESYFAYKPVDHLKNKKNLTKKIRKMVKNWPGDGSSVCYMLDL